MARPLFQCSCEASFQSFEQREEHIQEEYRKGLQDIQVANEVQDRCQQSLSHLATEDEDSINESFANLASESDSQCNKVEA